MEDNRNQNRNFGNRNRSGRGPGPRHHHRGGSGGRSRSQRPLLTSAINACGLTLVALMLVDQVAQPQVFGALAVAVLLYSLSALVSYVAQRISVAFVELASDLLFIVGTMMIIFVALTKLG